MLGKKRKIIALKPKTSLSLLGLFIAPIIFALGINACDIGDNNRLETLRLSLVSWPGFDIALYGTEAGLFQKRGLDVELIRFQNAQDAARATIRGSLDAAFVPLWDVMQVDPGNESPVFVMVSNISHGSDGIVSQPEIKSVKDLRGKRVAAKLGTVNHLILLEALKLHNIKPEEVDIEDVSNEIGVQQMKEGKIDGAVLWQPLLSDTAKAINGNIVYTTKEINSLVIDGMVTRPSVVESKKEELTQFFLAWFDIMDAVETKPQEVFDTVGKALGQTGASFARDYAGLKKGDIAMNRQMFAPEGSLQEAMEQIAEWLRSDPRHGKRVREDVEIDAEPITAAMKAWKPL